MSRYRGELQPPYEPQPVDNLRAVFPTDVADLMPPMDAIPQDFRRNRGDARSWIRLQQQWFYHGLDTGDMRAGPGIDKAAALRHLGAIQGSWEPPHEYKEAAVAFLLSLWFDNPPEGE